MSIFTDLFRPTPTAGVTTTTVSLTDTSGWYSGTASGATVTPETALRLSTVWACVRLISDCVGMLPLVVYERLANGDRERAVDHPLYDILHDQANYRQTAFQFKKMLTAHLLLRGNGYALIVPGPRGFADQLIPLHPDRMQPEETADGRMRYIYYAPNGKRQVYTDDEIFHLRGLSLDGVRGVGVVEYGRETIGTAIARERYGARFFMNDSTPGGLLKTAGKLSPEAAKRMAADWREMHSAAAGPHKIAVLEEGLEYQAIGLTNKDSQFLELGEATAEQIAGQLFGVPPHMVGLTSKATSWGSGIEEMSLGFVTFTLMPWLTEWEQSITRDLIIASQKYFAEFVPDALLKGRTLERYNAYQIARNIGLMSPNEMRRRENMNRRNDPDGDSYMLTPAGAPAQPPRGDAGAHYRRLLSESAARVARKEAAALTRLAKRSVTDDEFGAACADFLVTHGAFVAETLQIGEKVSAEYIEYCRDDIATGGRAALGGWVERHTDRLIACVAAEGHE